MASKRPSKSSQSLSPPPDPLQAPPRDNPAYLERWLTTAVLPDQSMPGTPLQNALPTSWLRLQGTWLSEAGFVPNTLCLIRVMSGCLVITVA
jgi:hypothetical protein